MCAHADRQQRQTKKPSEGRIYEDHCCLSVRAHRSEIKEIASVVLGIVHLGRSLRLLVEVGPSRPRASTHFWLLSAAKQGELLRLKPCPESSNVSSRRRLDLASQPAVYLEPRRLRWGRRSGEGS